MSKTDQIRKEVLLKAPMDRVWRAISDSAEFGRWFGAEISGPFVAGERVEATLCPTEFDPEIAKYQERYAGTSFGLWVERVDAPRVLAFRWQPGLEDVEVDGVLLTTLVQFELREAENGTKLTITESGFDHFPAEKRAKIFTGNEQGWEGQSTLIRKYLQAHAS